MGMKSAEKGLYWTSIYVNNGVKRCAGENQTARLRSKGNIR